MLRGFDQATVLSRTGTDIGYHGSGMKVHAKGIDRFEYKVVHVQQRVDSAVIQVSLDAYARRASKTEVLAVLGLSGENIVTLRKLYAALDWLEQFKVADKAQRLGSMRAGMMEKHGVDNAFKLAEFQEKAEDTREVKYGAKYTLAAGSVLAAGARETFAGNMNDPDFAADLQSRKSATTMERFGVEHPSQSPEVQAKTRATHLRRYGVEHSNQRPEERARRSELAKREGKRWAKKAKLTNLARYGVINSSQLPERRAQQSKAMRATHVARGLKARKTTFERYGVDYASQTPERRASLSAFMKENGPEFARLSQAVMLERHGVVSVHQLPEYRLRQSQRMLDPLHQARVNAAKKRNGTFNASKPEVALGVLLVEHFGSDDVKDQYRDPRYPFRCDFYIPSRDMFIELNGLWTHNDHWFDAENPEDQAQVAEWAGKIPAFYAAAIRDWCGRDVKKRITAATSELNYVVLWGQHAVRDARLWLAAGAPDRQDWR